MGMTQMNTRIDADLKRGGDEVFARMGLTPSEVVRAVWAYAVEHAEAPAVISSALSTSADEASGLETAFRVAVAQHASNLVAGYRESLGVPAPDRLDVIDYDVLREGAWAEKLETEGVA